MRLFSLRPKWRLKTERVSFTHELYITRGACKLFICELHVNPIYARDNILILEQAMIFVDLLNAQHFKDQDMLKAVAWLRGDRIVGDDIGT